jgi:hypothetical protein
MGRDLKFNRVFEYVNLDALCVVDRRIVDYIGVPYVVLGGDSHTLYGVGDGVYNYKSPSNNPTYFVTEPLELGQCIRIHLPRSFLRASYLGLFDGFLNMKENQFETIKRLDDQGKEYWSSRELAKELEYADYRNFLTAIGKARTACENSGEVIHNHFVDATDMVKIGSGAEKPIDTMFLSRYAC